ncbi:MAG TPA: SpoIVB peptidase [Firmicutes bacterium]|nr:SpoIVB peptidase [Bacillota bacterium]
MGGSRRRTALAAVFIILLASGSFVLLFFLKQPLYVRLLAGQEQLLQVLPFFTLRESAGSREILVRTDEGFAIRPQQLGRIDLELRFMDIIPLRQMVVDVVPQIYVRPGGQAVGILLTSRGLIVSRTFPVLGIDGKEYYPARDAGILPGDVIEEIAGQPVRSVQQAAALIDRLGQSGKDINLTIKRQGSRLPLRIRPVAVEGGLGRSAVPRYMLGIVLEEPTAGVGTLTFYHPGSGKYGALGHLVTTPTSSPAHIEDGRIVRAQISEIRRGLRGSPGEKRGTFRSEQDVVGTIDKNTKFGIFGRLTADVVPSAWDREVPVALAANVKAGPAEILTVLDGERVESFAVEIIKVNAQNRPDDKGIILKVTDERLLSRTGGIIQGMSGSPILQDGALVGAVTHVFVNDPQRGYGVFAEWMLHEAGLWSGGSEKEAQLPAPSAARRLAS